MLEYRRMVIRTAWDRFTRRLFDGARQVMGFIFQTTILFAILYYQPLLGDVQAEARLAAAGVASVLLSVMLSFLWDLFRAPEVIWSELKGRVDEMERIIRPKFSVLVSNGGSPRRYTYGHMHRSPYTGWTQAVEGTSFNALALDVTNETATTLENCEAYLSRIEEIGGEPGVFQSMRLEWVPVGDEIAVVTIPSSGQRTVVLFQVVGQRVAFSHDNMPLQAAMMLKEDGHYCGVVTLSAKNTTTSYVGFNLICRKDEPPHFTLARRGFRDAEIIEWAPETFIGI